MQLFALFLSANCTHNYSNKQTKEIKGWGPMLCPQSVKRKSDIIWLQRSLCRLEDCECSIVVSVDWCSTLLFRSLLTSRESLMSTRENESVNFQIQNAFDWDPQSPVPISTFASKVQIQEKKLILLNSTWFGVLTRRLCQCTSYRYR